MSLKTHQMHAIEKREIQKGRISIMTPHIRRRSLTFPIIKMQAGLLVDILMKSINEVNDEDYLNAPRELQDEGVPGSINLKAGNDQPHDATTGPQDDKTSAFDFHIDQSLSSPLDPGLSHVSPTCHLFDVGPDSEPDGEREGEEYRGQCGDTYIWFKPDIWFEAEGDSNI